MSPARRPGRVRVVLAHRAGARAVRPRTELDEQTDYGEELVRALTRAQLYLALRIGLGTAVVLAAMPLITALVPGADRLAIGGIGIGWLLLGVVVYPALYLIGRRYVRSAERVEHDLTRFADR